MSYVIAIVGTAAVLLALFGIPTPFAPRVSASMKALSSQAECAMFAPEDIPDCITAVEQSLAEWKRQWPLRAGWPLYYKVWECHELTIELLEQSIEGSRDTDKLVRCFQEARKLYDRYPKQET